MEMWDVYDDDGERTERQIPRGPVADGIYHLTVSACLFAPDGMMLIQQRNRLKESFPLYWEFSVGGSALSGENAREAVTRETKEELGLSLPFVRSFLRVSSPHAYHEYFLMEIRKGVDELVLQEEEVKAVKWADRETISKMIDNGEFLPVDKSLVNLLFDLHARESWGK